jgi:hypothetical protein
MQRLFIATLLASVAIAPAYAKDKNRGALEAIQGQLEDRALDRYENKIERLEGRLEGAGDDERQRIENIIESVTEKYEAKWGELPEEPPPPPPEPEPPLFKDDFNRDQSIVGNGWGGSNISNDEGRLRIAGGEAWHVVDLDGKAYKSFTITATFDTESGLPSAGWANGDRNAVELQWQPFYSTVVEGSKVTWTTPEGHMDKFSFSFADGDTFLDDIVVTGILADPVEPFVGF